ncbi:hypothetical protein EST38_g1271 [Candolleomyces aberdarensis]|uniref:Uncharacterized protein n=1 Tax=Candolleomyces aberdarensis TaxID=2316362 RepID=A0A4Q2DVB3_9AGAR|nr:hypothetical protein EST38_g1271 [Candolleomyces aberdarensis]
MSGPSYAQYDIDNDDNLFNFDPYDMLSSRTSRQHALAQLVPALGLNTAASTPSHDTTFTSEEQDEQTGASSKGKQVSMPMPIRPTAITHDVFDVSPSNSDVVMGPSSFSPSNFSSFDSSSFTFSSPGSSRGTYEPYIPSSSFPEALPMDDDGSPSPLTGDKGKGREVPPTLPPLSLGPMELGDHDSWMYFDSNRSAGPSSLNSPGPLSAVSETPADDSTNSISLSPSPPISPTTAESPLTSSGLRDVFHDGYLKVETFHDAE